jgi:hypothetical protein
MASVNTLKNNLLSKNTGLVSKPFDPKRIAGAIITPKGYSLTAAQVATLQTKLAADAALDTKALRIYPVANFLDFKDNSEKPVEQSFSTGAEVTVRDGVYKFGFQFTKGGQSLQAALRAFNGSNWDFLFIDDSNQIIGTYYLDATGALGIKAIPSIEIYTSAWMLNDGKKVAEYVINFKFFPKWINENRAYIAVDPTTEFDVLQTVTGLKDVQLKVTGSATPGTYYVQLFDTENVNLFGELNPGMAAAAMYKVTNTLNGGTITPTSVTADVANQRFTMVLPTTGNYPTGTGQDTKLTIDLVGPTELIAGNVEGIESLGAFTITKN